MCWYSHDKINYVSNKIKIARNKERVMLDNLIELKHGREFLIIKYMFASNTKLACNNCNKCIKLLGYFYVLMDKTFS